MPTQGSRDRQRAPRAKAVRTNPFFALLSSVQREVDHRLASVLDRHVDAVERRGADVGEMIAALQDLCQRGGKRLRPALVAVGVRTVQPDASLDLALEAGVALELLQAYFLIHDDWMDQDLERRGGPTVHAHLTRRFRSSDKGAAAAILTGDYAVALATQVLAGLPVPARQLPRILNCFTEMQLDAVVGQGLDVLGHARDIELTYRLKTASYTVRGPLMLGALLLGGTPSVLNTLDRFSLPAGIAFQLRDDLIGVFGQTGRTGKPQGSDLKAGKRTALIELGLRKCRGKDRETLRAVFGNARATTRQVERAIDLLESSGAKQTVEDRITVLAEEAREVLTASRLPLDGRLLLEGALDALVLREA